MLAHETITDPAQLPALAGEWDELAAECRQPLSSAAWSIAQWRHFPNDGELRVVVVRDGERLVAIAPFFADRARSGRVDYRLLGAVMPRSSPLSLPAREWESGAAVAAALADAPAPRPDVIAFESVAVGSPWPLAVAANWPGRLRPPSRCYRIQPSPTVTLGYDRYDDWLATKSSNFRSQMRRARRQFEAAGGVARRTTPETFASDLDAFTRLHSLRWDGLGESEIVTQRAAWDAVHHDVARAELADGRLRLYLLEIDGEPISAQMFAAAGGEAMHLNGGWDERYAKLKPSQLGILAGLADAIEHGDTRLDLGPGEQPYKWRMADGNDPVAWTVLAVPGARLPLTLARLAPEIVGVEGRETVKRLLGAEQVERLRSLRARLSR